MNALLVLTTAMNIQLVLMLKANICARAMKVLQELEKNVTVRYKHSNCFRCVVNLGRTYVIFVIEITCPAPASPSLGHYVNISTSVFTHGSSIQFICNVGYFASSKQITCRNGLWVPSVVSCTGEHLRFSCYIE